MEIIYHITAKVEAEMSEGSQCVFHGTLSFSWTDEANAQLAIPVDRSEWEKHNIGDELIFRLSDKLTA